MKEVIHAALAFDSAQQDGKPVVIDRRRQDVVDDPMDLDVVETRCDGAREFTTRDRGNYDVRDNSFRGNGSNYIRGSGSSRTGSSIRVGASAGSAGGACFHCHNMGHLKRNYRTRLADIKKLDDQHSRQDFH